MEDRAVLLSGDWLSDNHIYAANSLLRCQFPHIDGLQSPLLGDKLQFSILHSEGVQILNCDRTHWICISTIGCKAGEVNIFDSLYTQLLPKALRQICCLLHTSEKHLTINFMNTPLQLGGSDCGVFAISCATSLCSREDPCVKSWDQAMMRSHLRECFENQMLTTFPIGPKPRKIPRRVKRSETVEVYCVCRLPWKQRMAQCDSCKEWFHSTCIDIPKAVFRKSVVWHCPQCM